MQGIGEVFGGTLENLPLVYHGVSTQLDVVDRQDALFRNLPPSFRIGRYHSWIVSRNGFPEELKITAVDENQQIMSLRHKKFQLYGVRSEEHTSELQSRPHLVCRLLLEKKKKST